MVFDLASLVKHSSFFLSTIGPGPWIPASALMLPSSSSVRPLTLFLIPDFLASCIAMVFAAKCLPGFLLFLLNRYQRVVVNGSQSSWSDVVLGVPQGTVFGPLLFLLYINDIIGNIQSNIPLFADDCIVYHTIRSQLKMTPVSCKMIYSVSRKKVSPPNILHWQVQTCPHCLVLNTQRDRSRCHDEGACFWSLSDDFFYTVAKWNVLGARKQ